MIIVLGSLETDAAHIEQLLADGLAHTRRSRTEPGCLSHDVAVDAENPNRLMFTERWADHDALQAHFAVPASGEFVDVARRVATASMDIYAVHSS